MTSAARFGLGLFAITLGITCQANGQGRAQEAVDDLAQDFPEVRVLWTGEEDRRARSIFGVPMTRGETVREAAENFLLNYGEALTGGEADFEHTQAIDRMDGSTVLHFQQYVDGVTVDGSIVRLLVRNGDDSGPVVVYASGHFARAPELGLPQPVVPAAAAVAAARLHSAGMELDEWAEPELVVTTESGILSRDAARLAWKVRGWTDVVASHSFWVDAVTGIIIRDADMTAHYCDPTPSVTGTVTGGTTPGTEPDKGVGHRCSANLPVASTLPELLVEITDATQSTVLDSAYTDEFGDFAFYGTSYPTDAVIRYSWKGPAWTMFEDDSGVSGCSPTSIPPAAKNLGSSFPVVHDHDFNPSPYTEFGTARVNLHRNLSKAREFVQSRVPPNSHPELNSNLVVIANSCEASVACGARYFPGPALGQDAVAYGITDLPTCDFNRAYSTIAVHEYGHFIAHRMFGIAPVVPHRDFHEGVADTLAMLVHDVTIYAENWEANCDPDRSPLTADPTPAFDCSYEAWHDDGMLLSAIWLELAADPTSGGIGLTAARQLFIDWGLLTAGGIEDGPVGCETDEKAAGPATLIEVLIADDDDGALNNGTPNDSVICTIFAARGITSSSSPCGGSLHGGICSVDLDRNGMVDTHDFLIYLDLLQNEDPKADWDGDGLILITDALAFANDFEEGC